MIVAHLTVKFSGLYLLVYETSPVIMPAAVRLGTLLRSLILLATMAPNVAAKPIL